MLDINYYQRQGHVFGECMSHPDSDLMYVNIPKNASSWTKPNLLDWSWENYNYHTDNLYHKNAIIVLRDPVDRWLSGIAEYLYLYHRDWPNEAFTESMLDLVFDKIAFDDHTEKQVYFVKGLDLSRCVFFWFDDNYRERFGRFLAENGMPNKYHRYAKQHVSDLEPIRKNYKEIFASAIKDSKYLYQIKQYFKQDYELIDSVTFYK
ncbi:hypothetical protein UFOVP190_425 [uncultured Caudovirales phage]|uniref:Sulfotransferase domain-containing protein n=1 Tax=uncultured Caudovirales phage TaxID=2100421 RepID=A0A6J7WLA3_9CAUD|nr:hypothetical protein UFOVP190_425 [uncultured Caudovirales phage]